MVPAIGAGEAARFGRADDFAELLVQGRAELEFGGEGGGKLALEVVANRRQVRHEPRTVRAPAGAFKGARTPTIQGVAIASLNS